MLHFGILINHRFRIVLSLSSTQLSDTEVEPSDRKATLVSPPKEVHTWIHTNRPHHPTPVRLPTYSQDSILGSSLCLLPPPSLPLPSFPPLSSLSFQSSSYSSQSPTLMLQRPPHLILPISHVTKVSLIPVLQRKTRVEMPGRYKSEQVELGFKPRQTGCRTSLSPSPRARILPVLRSCSSHVTGNLGAGVGVGWMKPHLVSPCTWTALGTVPGTQQCSTPMCGIKR